MRNSRWKLWVLRGLSIVLLAGWMNVISGFSAQEGTESSGLSMKVSCTVVRFYDRMIGKTETEAQVILRAEKVEYGVRKLAHMTEFGILAVLFLLVFAAFGRKRYRSLWAAAAAFLYASLDEFHQLFVPGRSARVTDVLFDTAGAVLAVVFVRLLLRLVAGMKNHMRERGDFCGRIR